jgi:flagellar biosynthesis protein FlhB
MRDHAADFVSLAGRTSYVALLSSDVTLSLMKKVAAIGLALGLVDLLVTRTSWKKKLMMSKDDIKREHKESEGDPETKAARERARHEMLASAAIGNVKTASVVVVNPTHIACALRYDEKEGDEAPVVVASGEGDMAQRIMQAARDYGVPILRDVPLARALHELEIGDQIPEALYEAVAAILREAWDDPSSHL